MSIWLRTLEPKLVTTPVRGMNKRNESSYTTPRPFWKTGASFLFLALSLSLTAVVCTKSRAEGIAADFNGNSRVDFADFFLFTDVFGGTDPTYDLDGSGQVDFEDLFLFSDHFGEKSAELTPAGENASAASLPEPVAYTAASTPRNTTFQFPSYRITVQNGRPFGIVSLRLTGQPVDFVHPTLPMGDWEWFWFERTDIPGERVAAKLVQAEWSAPVVERRADQAVLRFGRRDIFLEGIYLDVTYRLRADRPEFAIKYAVHNQSVDRLGHPYAMLGFPGFSDHRWISQVATGTGVRPVKPPFFNFQAEARAEGRAIHLLRQDMNPRGADRELRNALSIQMGPATYTLTVNYVAGHGLERVYSAHANKLRYLTSHLYAFLTEMAPGESRSLTIHYKLSRE